MAYEFTLDFDATQEADERLQREVWDVLMGVFSNYLMDEGTIWPYLRKVTIHGAKEGWWQHEPGQLRFTFPTEEGTRERAAAACAHWAERAAAMRWLTLENVADHSDVTLGDRPDLRALLEVPDRLFATLGDETWLIAPADGTPGLIGDGAERSWTNLEEKERERVQSIVERGRCGCRLCSRLRPDAEWESEWREALTSGDPSRADRAAGFLLQSVTPSTEALIDLAAASQRQSAYRHLRSMFELGQRLGAERLAGLREAAEANDDPATRAALVACIAGLPISAVTRTSVLLEFAEDEPPVAETAVEFLGYGDIPPDGLLELADRLGELVGERDDLDYAVALTLYNVFREEDYPPGIVKEVLRELARGSGEQADVARRAIAWFDGA